MTHIQLETEINAPISICYNLSRSIDVHLYSAIHTDERAIAGRVSGMIDKGEFVTWSARHFGIVHEMTVEICETIKPYFFADRMVRGPFQHMHHTHIFQKFGNTTVMRDDFEYSVPLGWLGKLFDVVILRRYLTKFLLHRNEVIKMLAESGEWKSLLQTSNMTYV